MADAANSAQSAALPWWRFSLRQLLAATALIAVGCVGLLNANTTWVGALFGLVWLALGASLLLAVYRDGQERAFWVGFAVLGWLYLLLPMFGGSLGKGLQEGTLITTRLSHGAYDWLYFDPESPEYVEYSPSMPLGMSMGSPGGPMYPGSSGGPMSGDGGMPGMGMGGASAAPAPVKPPFSGPTKQDFTSVSHALWTLLLAICGGQFGKYLFATRRRSGAGFQPATPS